MYFYFMNDWRSTFQGANDHEADLEQSFVFLEEGPDGPKPVWFACAAHDYSGDDLRRRWDDPLLVREGDHPVIHAGAGSHAAYFEQGEYLTAAPIPAARVRSGACSRRLRSFWRDTLRQDDPGDLARADRRCPEHPVHRLCPRRRTVHRTRRGRPPWSPVLIDDDTPWVDGYRGLFGLDTYDRFAGERAPAGPKWNRAGVVRQTWHDPVGWAGLAKVATPSRAPMALEERIAAMEAELAEIRASDGTRVPACPASSSRSEPSAPASRTPTCTPLEPPTSPVREAELVGARRREAAAPRRDHRFAAGARADPRPATSATRARTSAATTIPSRPS